MQQFGPHCLQLSHLNQFQEFKNHFFSYAAVTQYMTWTYCMNFIMKSTGKPNMLSGHECSRDILKFKTTDLFWYINNLFKNYGNQYVY